MSDSLTITLDPASPLSLQQQVRQALVDAITRGVLRPGHALPASRRLAVQLGVSRNTVVLAYEALLAEGHIVSRERSGIFVAPDAPSGRVATGRRSVAPDSPVTLRLTPVATANDNFFRCPPNWHQYPFPFLDARCTPELLPLAEWREALRLTYSPREVLRWSPASGDADDRQLLEEVRTKLLPLRGIEVEPDELLVAMSARQAVQLTIALLVERNTTVILEEPVDADLYRALTRQSASVLCVDSAHDAPELRGALFITSSRRCAHSNQASTADSRRLLKLATERDWLILEQDEPWDIRDTERVLPALRSLDASGRVIYIGSLSAVAAAGAAPAIMVAHPRLIERAREQRQDMGGGLSAALQRAWGYFIGFGHYRAAVTRAERMLRERRTALRDALNHHLHKSVAIQTFPGAAAYWVRCASGVNVPELARKAAALGLLLESMRMPGEGNVLCMGVSSIARDQIRPGVMQLVRLMRSDPALAPRSLASEAHAILPGTQVRRALAGRTLLYSTVYGDPCTIEVRRDGTLFGRAGYGDEDCDTGRWWIEADRWYRQWNQWAYGEVTGFAIAIEGDQLRWYGSDGLLADTAVITRDARSTRGERRS